MARCPLQLSKVEESFRKHTCRFQNNNNGEEQNMLLGATGSRLLSGNTALAREIEERLAKIHNRSAALLCNSGYDANLCVMSSIPCDGDVIVMDSLAHNSLIMGARMSRVNYNKGGIEFFKHNDVTDLENILSRVLKRLKGRSKNASADDLESPQTGQIIIAVESVYSMDGDVAKLQPILDVALKYEASVVVDEAHALGVYGRTNFINLIVPDDQSRMPIYLRKDSDSIINHLPKNGGNTEYSHDKRGGTGVLAALELESHPALLASIYTFGKAAGCHGAVIAASKTVVEYLVNYARPFIYSTALPPHSLVSIQCSYDTMISFNEGERRRIKLFELVRLFRITFLKELERETQNVYNHDDNKDRFVLETRKDKYKLSKLNEWSQLLLPSPSPIQAVLCPGNKKCIKMARDLNNLGTFNVYPIRSPTVPKGSERIRIILHTHNNEDQIHALIALMMRLIKDLNPSTLAHPSLASRRNDDANMPVSKL